MCGLSVAFCGFTVVGSYLIFTTTLARTIADLPHPPRIEWIEAAAILAVTASVAFTVLGLLVSFALWTAGQTVWRTGKLTLLDALEEPTWWRGPAAFFRRRADPPPPVQPMP